MRATLRARAQPSRARRRRTERRLRLLSRDRSGARRRARHRRASAPGSPSARPGARSRRSRWSIHEDELDVVCRRETDEVADRISRGERGNTRRDRDRRPPRVQRRRFVRKLARRRPVGARRSPPASPGSRAARRAQGARRVRRRLREAPESPRAGWSVVPRARGRETGPASGSRARAHEAPAWARCRTPRRASPAPCGRRSSASACLPDR